MEISTSTLHKLPPSTSKSKKFITDLASGGTAAVISKTLTAPIDRVKIILQAQDAAKAIAAQQRYHGMLNAFIRVPKEQGILSLWRGNWANVIRYFPTQALNFAFKDTYKRIFMEGVDKNTQFWRFFAMNLAAGGAAGATSLCFVYPLDFTRTRLAMDVGREQNREFYGIVDCMKKIWKTDGIVGMYRGFMVSIQCMIVYRAAYFGIFDTAKSLSDQKINFFGTWTLALSTTIISGLLAYPWDTVRRRMMMQSGLREKLYKNSFECAIKSIKNEGFRAFYKGGLVNVYRGISGALVLSIYDQIQKKL